MPQTNYTPADVGRLGREIYHRDIRPKVEPENVVRVIVPSMKAMAAMIIDDAEMKVVEPLFDVANRAANASLRIGHNATHALGEQRDQGGIEDMEPSSTVAKTTFAGGSTVQPLQRWRPGSCVAAGKKSNSFLACSPGPAPADSLGLTIPTRMRIIHGEFQLLLISITYVVAEVTRSSVRKVPVQRVNDTASRHGN